MFPALDETALEDEASSLIADFEPHSSFSNKISVKDVSTYALKVPIVSDLIKEEFAFDFFKKYKAVKRHQRGTIGAYCIAAFEIEYPSSDNLITPATRNIINCLISSRERAVKRIKTLSKKELDLLSLRVEHYRMNLASLRARNKISEQATSAWKQSEDTLNVDNVTGKRLKTGYKYDKATPNENGYMTAISKSDARKTGLPVSTKERSVYREK